ncbi:MarR family winged helix-turn-helix transcriptional regulator [Pseudonocardia acaciae]|uniref:MarR family winged helix-turn-helix transcriptional regulator n=1 Tax=Pseudonocardia acaciae TaxID=551276 RepID=UPI0006860105|nr:MarR family transcriptional regulator [Pseudonocardia acaciae]
MSEGRLSDVVDEIVGGWRTELPQVAGVPLELAKRAGRLAGLIDAAVVTELDRLGRTKAEYEVLSRLRLVGRPYRRKPHELASSLLLSSGGTTNVLHRLTAAGLVVREADPDDRRSVWVRLTPEGVRAAEETVLAANAAQSELLGRLPEATARALADLLRDVLAAIDPGGIRDRARPGQTDRRSVGPR